MIKAAAVIWKRDKFYIFQNPQTLLWGFPTVEIKGGEAKKQAIEQAYSEKLSTKISLIEELVSVSFQEQESEITVYNAFTESKEIQSDYYSDIKLISKNEAKKFDFHCNSQRIISEITRSGISRLQLQNYCLSKNGAYIDHPFGPESDIIKVEGKIFAQFFVLKGEECVTFNCDKMSGEFYRRLYPGVIVRGYHCPPVMQPYFNTFPLNAGVSDDLVFEMADHSYETVVAKLPKYKQARLK